MSRIEKRKQTVSKSSPLPADYLSMVEEIFTANFDAGVKALDEMTNAPHRFLARGEVFADEVVIAVSLLCEGQLAATTVQASADFDPKASSPTVEDLLGACVDAAGALFGTLLSAENPERLAQVADQSLAALEDVPFQWAQVTVENRKVYLKIDKSNPLLDEMTDEWLSKHDPKFKERLKEEQEETEKLFVTGPKKGDKGPGTIH